MTAPSQAGSETCLLPAQHAGLTFPVEQIDANWACRLQAIVGDYTTAGKVGPIRTLLPETVYADLLDHPATIATLVNRLGIGPYRAVMRDAGQFWIDDGDGTQGMVQLVHRDRRARVYYLEGFHEGTLLPRVYGKAVVLLALNAVKEPNGADAVEAMLVTYTRLDNRLLAGFVAALRPLIGNAVTRKLVRGFDAANRLGQAMVQHPDWVLREATAPPALEAAEVAFVKQSLSSLPQISFSQRTGTVVP